MQRVGKLYRVDVTGDQIWDAYINGFTAEENPVFRHPESTYHNCNHDRNFIRRYGNVVAIDEENKIVHLFDFDAPEPYANAVNAVKDLFKGAKVVDAFVETFDVLNAMPYSKIKRGDNLFQLGHERTLKVYTPEEAAVYGMVTAGKTYEFNHFHVMLNRENLSFSNKSPEFLMTEKRAPAEVFQRLMEEVDVDTIELVIELIEQDSVKNSEQQVYKLAKIAKLKTEYGQLSESQKTNFCWKVAESLPYAKLRNESIGNLLVSLSQGMDLDDAVHSYNVKVDPANFMRSKTPIFTEKMKVETEKFIEEKGYLEAFNRRFASLSDINISEVYHKNVDGKVKNVGLFANVPSQKPTRHGKAKIDGVVEIGIGEFMSNVLPKATKIEALVKHNHAENFVALHTSDAEKGIFKWNNNFGWTYINGLTGVSTIKQEVKKAGGFVDAPFRFSIIWNENGGDIVDLDAHAKEPNGTHIYYGSDFLKSRGGYNKTSMGGQLDVDMRSPTTVGVENIYWESTEKLVDGIYKFEVNNYNDRNHNGFRAELYLNGETYTYVYEGKLTGTVTVATVEFENGEFVKVQGFIKEDKTSREVWGLSLNDFHTVKLVSLSPNYWGENKFDTKHYFFMLDNCKPDAPLASFHNQFLVGELLQFRKPLQILSDIRKIKPSEKCLAGLGFNATMRNSLVVKVVGTHTRFMKINF
jgi:hypothetical protein